MKIIYINPKAASIAGKTPQECLGKKCYEVLNTHHCQTANCRVAQALKTGKEDSAETILERGGQSVPIFYTGTPIFDKNGNIVAAMDQAVDISEMKNTIAELKRAANSLKDGNLKDRANLVGISGDYKELLDAYNSAIDNVLEPIHEVEACLERVAQGDFTTRMTGEYQGDHAKIKNAFNSTIISLEEILQQMFSVIEQVTAGAQQVADSSQSVSEGATRQASSLEEITSSITEVASQAKQNAEYAREANHIAEDSRASAEIGNKKMREMLKAISEISTSSQEISKIIKVIDEIAFQTNLLALNAAVEAARAGVYGKGFVVVAEEVRNLAQRSAKAAKETTELIERSVNNVQNGSAIAQETATALNEIIESVAKVSQLISEIATASDEQVQGIQQINQGLNQVDEVTQSNAANAEESASASEELSSQSAMLRKMLDRFTVSGRAANRRESQLQAPSYQQWEGLNNLIAAGSKEDMIVLDDDEFGSF
ncbi:MAG: methyl-accepting chemotaxis protein [Calditrichia bacterium]